MRKLYLIILISIYIIDGRAQGIIDTLDYISLREIVESGDTNNLSRLPYDFRNIKPESEYGVPLLFYACSNGNVDMVSFLLRHGSSPNEVTRYGTPANWAAEKGNLEVVNILLDNGLNPRIEEMSYWVQQYKSGDSHIPEWLNKAIVNVLEKSIDFKNYPYAEYVDPADPLILSASIIHDKSNNLELTKRLLKYNVNINLVDKRGMSPIHSSIMAINIPAVSLLIKNGANVNLPIYNEHFSLPIYNNNLTPLHLILYLIKERPEKFSENKEDILKMIKLLVKDGADVNAKLTNENQTVLDVAMEINDPDIIKILKKGLN